MVERPGYASCVHQHLVGLSHPILLRGTDVHGRGLVTAYGAYANYFTTGLLSSYSATDIAWPGTLQAVLIIAVGVISGPLFDRG